MPSELDQIRREVQLQMDAHQGKIDGQISSIDRWIQTASNALDKLAELQVQFHSSREASLVERSMNDEFKRDLKDQLKKLTDKVDGLETKTQALTLKLTFLIGGGMVAINLILWALERFV